MYKGYKVFTEGSTSRSLAIQKQQIRIRWLSGYYNNEADEIAGELARRVLRGTLR